MGEPVPTTIAVAVIDDDASVCRALARLLHASGIHAVTYASAEEFLQDPHHLAFDCLVVDVELAELSGVGLQQQLNDSGGGPPAIFVTADDDPATRQRLVQLGCVAYLRKTSSGQELLRTVKSVVAARASQHETKAGEPQ